MLRIDQHQINMTKCLDEQSSMSATPILLHSGLPWSNPKKIIISSAQYISNAVINRGLLHLLNNQYYLDVKSEAINNYIQQNIAKHLQSTQIHVPWSKIISLVNNLKVATKSSCYCIPLTQVVDGKRVKILATRVNQWINQIPKSLNGHSVIIKFVHGRLEDDPAGIDLESWAKVDLQNQCLQISNFINGTVVLTCQQTQMAFQDYSIQSFQQRASTVSRQFSAIQARVDAANGYSYLDGDSAAPIELVGTGKNQCYAVIEISDCQANVFLVGMKVRNRLLIDQLPGKVLSLPSKDQVLLYWPLTKLSSLEKSRDQIDEKTLYTNYDYLYQNQSYPLHWTSDRKKPIQESWDMLYLNSSQYLKTANAPEWLQFDLDGSMTRSQQIRDLVYARDQSVRDDVTLAFFGCLRDPKSSAYTNNPIFSDFNVTSDGQKSGMYVYLNKMLSIGQGLKTDQAQYQGDFQKSIQELIGVSGLYVLQFVHNPLTEAQSELHKTYLKSDICGPLPNGHMFVNLGFYPLVQEGETARYVRLIPNQSTVSDITQWDGDLAELQQKLLDVGYMVACPKQAEVSYPIKLFANAPMSVSNLSLKNWDYFTGQVRGVFLFRKRLLFDQIQKILQCGVLADSYDWCSSSQKTASVSFSASSYVAALHSVNNQSLNLIDTQISTQDEG